MPTRKQGNAIATGESSKSVCQASVLPLLKHADPKPTTKVSIRWLPVDLPEHVFWRSVEPALPWFDPQSVGSLVQKEREVLHRPCSLPEAVSADNGAASAEAEATLEQDAAPRDEGAESVGDAQVPLATGDVLPSSKGTTTMAMVDVYESRNLDRLDSKPYWRAFVPGKQHQSKAKPTNPSRAYILFATREEVDHFYKRYHGHVFSKNGAVSRAVVELAAFQHVPWSVGASTVDRLSGTIDDDPDFIAFLAMDPNSIDDGAKDEATTAEGGRPLSHVSYAAAASSSANARSEGDARGSAAAETTTPLINYLRELKGMSAGRRSAARPSVSSAQAKQAAQSSAAKSSTSTPNRSGDVTPKKPRRRNR
ncbi:hypothetical protein GGF42_004266 [Coemansia sp. RSA 2424]|nr:hypothetical protein GGF42_004266 [Coemansia sp. RSA 2424]